MLRHIQILLIGFEHEWIGDNSLKEQRSQPKKSMALATKPHQWQIIHHRSPKIPALLFQFLLGPRNQQRRSVDIRDKL